MSSIDRDVLLEDIKLYMRPDNKFSDFEMNRLIDGVVISVGDNDDNYEQILCKGLKSIALNNKAQSTSAGSIKSRKINGAIEESYYQNNASGTWDDYIDSLADVCSGFGYTGLEEIHTGCMVINTDAGTASADDSYFINVNPKETDSDNIFEYGL